MYLDFDSVLNYRSETTRGANSFFSYGNVNKAVSFNSNGNMLKHDASRTLRSSWFKVQSWFFDNGVSGKCLMFDV